MKKIIKIECPVCKTILIIDVVEEKIIEIRKPLITESTGDRFTDAVEKYKKDKLAAKEKFLKAQQDLDEKKKKLNEFFSQSVKEVTEKGAVEKEIRDIDLD